jgi:hypothetical protein
MKILPVRRAVAGLSLGALAGVGLVSVPTAAHAAVAESQIGGLSGISGWNCQGDGHGLEPDTVPWADNTVPVSKGTSAAATFTGGEGDTVAVATSTNASITASPLGAGPATITGTATASASALPNGTETDCEVNATASAMAQGTFTLTEATWVTVTATGQGQRNGRAFGTSLVGIGSAELFGSSWEGLLLFGGDGLMVSAGNRGSATSSTLLQPGEYSVAFGSIAYAVTHEEFPGFPSEAQSTLEGGSASYTGSFRVDFSKPGTASPITGAGASKVQFGERDCASGNVAVNLSKKTVKKAKRVAVRVNGAKGQVLKGKSLKGKKPKATTIVVPTSATGVTKVKVKITLTNGRRMQATRSYLPCK